MASFAEQSVSRSLHAVLAELPVGADISESDDFKSLLSGLERFVPELLLELHAEWERESLDGIYSFSARKTGTREAAIFGVCILISDQTLTPLEIRLQNEMSKRFYASAWRPETIDWVYAVAFGERLPD